MSEPRISNAGAKSAAIAGLLASALALLVPLVFGLLRPQYSHVRNYISELGETGAPQTVWVNWAGFLPIGLLVLLFLYLASDPLPIDRKSIALVSFLGWGYVVAAFFPCDPGCPERGSMSQMVHNLFGILSYPAAILGLMRMAQSFRTNAAWKNLSPFTMACSFFVAAGFGLMLVPELAPWRGLSQRVAEIAAFGWIVVISLSLWRIP